MCKLLAVVEIENQKHAETFGRMAIPLMTESDPHGLGIMRLGENGVHIQRWLEPPEVIRRKESKHLKKYASILRHQQNEAGTRSRRLDALAIHARYATCEKTLANVHPFYKDGTALMHNGVITNDEKFLKTVSTCDSEALLSQYLAHGVKHSNGKLSDALEGVEGYQAAIVFNDSGVIDIWRDAVATLHIAHVRGVGVVIATTAEIITTTAKRCKAYITGIDEILPYSVVRWQNGVSPTNGTFKCVQPVKVTPYDLTPSGSLEVIERHKASVSDAASDDEQKALDEWWRNNPDTRAAYYDDARPADNAPHWWEMTDDEQRQAAYDRHRKQIQAEIDDADAQYLASIQAGKRGGRP